MAIYEIQDDRGTIHSFVDENEAYLAWSAMCGNKECFESLEEFEKAREEYDNLSSYEGDLKLVEVLASFG